jgi:hypothetical protein
MQVSSAWSRFVVACVAVLLASTAVVGIRSSVASATPLSQIDLLNPAGDQAESEFGQHVTVLPNGNIVVNDPLFDLGTKLDVGAVYLFDGTTLALTSRLTGTASGDHVGEAVEVLSNGNFVIYSSAWDNGSAVGAGAITWASGSTGVAGVVSAANSLVGVSSDDRVGVGRVVPLSNGNYLVASPRWDNGSIVDAGAVTWVNGVSGAKGAIDATNSLVGSSTEDLIGNYVVALPNGGYLVPSWHWDNGSVADAGAVTWGSGAGGVKGVVSTANSLVGSTRFDQIGGEGVTVLSNGDYCRTQPVLGQRFGG